MQPEQENWQQPSQPSSDYHPETPATDQLDPASAAPALDNQPESTLTPNPRDDEAEAVRWQAAEYIHRDKSAVWYIVFGVIVLLLMLLAIFAFNSWTFAVLVPLMAAALMVYNLRPPATINYTLSRKGLHINDRLYPFDDFKEFGVISGDDEFSILLVPRKRFAPGVTIYFPESAGEAIVDMLAARLPMHEIRLDPLDQLIRWLRI